MLRNRFTTLKPGASLGDLDGRQLSCTIRFLDDSEPIQISYERIATGKYLYDEVCSRLDLLEKDYFGLRYVDSEKQRHWLDLAKPLYKQLKHVKPVVLCFRVKFYPSDPTKLREEITRYFLFLQLRRDLHHGRLLCPLTDANQLAAYIIQAELGDYDPREHSADYVGKFRMLPKQTQRQEEQIAEVHKTLSGQSQSEAESNFLQKAVQLETYGVDPHPVKDQSGNQMYLGVMHLGIVTFQGSKRTQLFPWSQVTRITFEGKVFIIHIAITEEEENYLLIQRKKQAIGFKCPTLAAAKHLWKCAVEQQLFFTLVSTNEIPKVLSGGGLLRRGSTFRFSGRCEREAYNDFNFERNGPPRFIRTSSNPQFAKDYSSRRGGSVPAKFNGLGLSDDSLDTLNSTTSQDSRTFDDISPSISLRRPMDLADHMIPEETFSDENRSPTTPVKPETEELEGQRILPEGSDVSDPASTPAGANTPESELRYRGALTYNEASLKSLPEIQISHHHNNGNVSPVILDNCTNDFVQRSKESSNYATSTFSSSPVFAILFWAFIFAVFLLTALFIGAAFFMDFDHTDYKSASSNV